MKTGRSGEQRDNDIQKTLEIAKIARLELDHFAKNKAGGQQSARNDGEGAKYKAARW